MASRVERKHTESDARVKNSNINDAIIEKKSKLASKNVQSIYREIYI